MSPRKIFFNLGLVGTILCLSSGYVLSGYWIGAVFAILTGFAWLLAQKYQAIWLAHLCLFTSVCLAAAGRLAGSPVWLMICGSASALAVWDLLYKDGCSFRYESKHLQLLALALGCGLFMVFLGRLLNLQIPFVVLVLFIVLAVFGLDRIWNNIKKRVSTLTISDSTA